MATWGSQKGMAYTKLVHVAADKDTKPSSTNFIFNGGTSLQQVLRVSINSVGFYNNIYNIYNDTRGANNTYTYQYGFNRTFTLTPGFYNIGTILNLMNADLVAAGAGGDVSWTFNPITNYVSLNVVSAGSQLVLNVPGPNPPLGLMTTLGGGVFLETKNFNAMPGVYQGATFPLLSGPTKLYLRSSALSPCNGIQNDGVFINTLLALPVTAAPNTYNLFDCKVDSLCEISYKIPRNLNFIDIQLTDRYGNIMDLHGGSLDIELRIWCNTI